jgi:hypothetical protein
MRLLRGGSSLKCQGGLPAKLTHYPKTAWYKTIKSVRVDGDIVIAQVNPATQARGACRGISWFVYDRTRSHQLRAVRIEDLQNQVIIHRRSAADPCR